MNTAIIAIRPEPGLSATIAAGAERGLEVIGSALSQVEPVAWEIPETGEFDALLVGSANVFRHGGAPLERLSHLPVHAVGEATAAEARAAGFEVAATGEGGLQSLLDQQSEPIRYLRLAGEERITLHPPEGASITERVVYRVADIPMDDELAKTLSGGGIVLLHSASSASHLARECDRRSIDRSRIALAALGPRILAAAGSGWRLAKTPERPNNAELLEMVRHMCQ